MKKFVFIKPEKSIGTGEHGEQATEGRRAFPADRVRYGVKNGGLLADATEPQSPGSRIFNFSVSPLSE